MRANAVKTVENNKPFAKKEKGERLKKQLCDNKYLFLLFLPGFLVFFMFKYVPLAGLLMAFQDYNFVDGIFGSKFVGLLQFKKLFSTSGFLLALKNTLKISFLKILFGFPAPIILALLLNEVKQLKFKRFVQTVSYLPHFFSWVVISGLLSVFLAPTTGVVNKIITSLGGEAIYFLADKKWFVTMLVVSDIWKEIGWGSIVYLAALTAISPDLYEAATIDGAKRWHKIFYITIPEIVPTIVVMFIMKLGTVLDGGFDQIFNMYNTAVMDVADIIDTYTYRMGIGSFEYSFSTAASLFKSVVAAILMVSGNWLCRTISDGELGIF